MDAKSKAVRAHRSRLKKSGMARVEVCVPSREAAVIRRAACVLREQASEADRLRQVLGFAPEPANAAELFAMPEALSPAGEALWDNAMAQIERDRKDAQLGALRKSAL